ncbi:MAG: 4'-phosphopantetheinyl transferase superfamily protein [Kangiellaceae bacterium]|nr:4'-phosphopantetheinyl transferase superfamily protein [Kangiellaceae bacterium]
MKIILDRELQSDIFNLLLPEEVRWFITEGVPSKFQLSHAEVSLTNKMSRKRLDDFRASRYCGQQVLRQLSVYDFSLLINNLRAPAWPRGIVGSLSHCESVCVGVAANENSILGIGIDIERSTPINESYLSIICTETDKLAIEKQNDPLSAAKILFSIKESIFKCLHPRFEHWIDFKDVDVFLDMANSRYTAKPCGDFAEQIKIETITGRWYQDRDWVISSCWQNSK